VTQHKSIGLYPAKQEESETIIVIPHVAHAPFPRDVSPCGVLGGLPAAGFGIHKFVHFSRIPESVKRNYPMSTGEHG
jgi:hypothetical protein